MGDLSLGDGHCTVVEGHVHRWAAPQPELEHDVAPTCGIGVDELRESLQNARDRNEGLSTRNAPRGSGSPREVDAMDDELLDVERDRAGTVGLDVEEASRGIA